MEVKPFITQDEIQRRIAALAQEIKAEHPAGEGLLFIAVLKGAFVFAADLLRSLPGPLDIDFISVSSYAGTNSTGHVRLMQDLSCDIAGRQVVLIEDIIDTGVTVDYLLTTLSVRKPASLKVCTLLYKPAHHRMRHHIDYVGFEIPDRFVVGYGMDYDGRYRELPYIGVLEG